MILYHPDSCCAALTPIDAAIIGAARATILPMLYGDRRDFQVMRTEEYGAEAFRAQVGIRARPMMRRVLWRTARLLIEEGG